MKSALSREHTATAWLLRREEEGWSAADHALLEAWLNADPRNRVAYYRMQFGWQKADRLAALREPVVPVRADSARTWWRRGGFGPAFAIAASLALAAVIVWHLGVFDRHTYTTSVGGRSEVPLSDGTKIELNTDTRLRTEVNANSRTVWLENGEAYFDVAHDATRPFVVHGGTRDITVLGTKFSVRRDGDRVDVVVLEGRVRVDDLSASPEPTIVITRGDIAVSQGAALKITHSEEHAVDDLSWRQGMLTFNEMTLVDAAAEFNRYNHKQLVVVDPRAAAVHIGGSFDATNVEAFVRLLKQGFGLTVEDEGNVIRISR
jgi:transmembrane sensor